jgi:hypothetical protein
MLEAVEVDWFNARGVQVEADIDELHRSNALAVSLP